MDFQFTSPEKKQRFNEDLQFSQYLTPELKSQSQQNMFYVSKNQKQNLDDTDFTEHVKNQNLSQGEIQKNISNQKVQVSQNLFSSCTQSQSSGGGGTLVFFQSPQSQKEQYQDRFIPCRTTAVSRSLFGLKQETVQCNSGKKLDFGGVLQSSLFQQQNQQQNQIFSQQEKMDEEKDGEELEKKKAYSNLLQHQLIFGSPINNENDCEDQKQDLNILKFKSPQPEKLFFPELFQSNSAQKEFSTPKKIIQKQPTKVLDAPGLIDDFYIDVLDWSQSSSFSLISICLGDSVYLWDPKTGEATKLFKQESEQNSFTSLKFRPFNSQIVLSTLEGSSSLVDCNTQQKIFSFQGHEKRVGTMSFQDQNLLACGSRDGTISIWDLRNNGQVQKKLKTHKQEVCGLVWSHSNEKLLASGGNDNVVNLYNLTNSQNLAKIKEHKAAVRALDFSPHQSGILITGGGTKDQQICVWNTLTNNHVKTIKVDSQVCKLQFSKNSNQFVSTHGFEKNEIAVWQYKDFTKDAVLSGHESRVLYLAASPDGESIVTGAGDETLKFWKVFPSKKIPQTSSLSFSISDLR